MSPRILLKLLYIRNEPENFLGSMNLRYSFFQEKKICKNIVPKVDKTTLNWLIPRRVAKGVLFIEPKMNKDINISKTKRFCKMCLPSS